MKFMPLLTALYFSGAQVLGEIMPRLPQRNLERFERPRAR
jgi:hypothetical protein